MVTFASLVNSKLSFGGGFLDLQISLWEKVTKPNNEN